MHLSIASITEEKTDAELRVQILANDRKDTKSGKPYYQLEFSDGSAVGKMRVWSDRLAFAAVSAMQKGQCYALTGTFWRGEYGLEGDSFTVSAPLEGDERAAIFAGPPELREKQAEDWAWIVSSVRALVPTPLATMAKMFLDECEEPFRRAAAARGNHHARRGGLVEHVSFMMRAAVAMCGVYPELHRDLLICAVLFHDAGKMIENQYEKEGFETPFDLRSEACGHIVIGVEMARNFWRKLPAELTADERPLHLLCHCIVAHHGLVEWGSPVPPKLPEAAVLHFIDNMDTKLEMMRAARLTGKKLAPGVVEGPYHMKTVLTWPDAEAEK